MIALSASWSGGKAMLGESGFSVMASYTWEKRQVRQVQNLNNKKKITIKYKISGVCFPRKKRKKKHILREVPMNEKKKRTG